MNQIHLITMLVTLMVIGVCWTEPVISGQFETYNQPKTMAKTTEKFKNFIGIFRNRNNRPPAHDTPASLCSCSKFKSHMG